MLTTTPKKRIVSKMIRLEGGEWARAYFLVAEFEGKIFWKLLKIEKSDSGFRIPSRAITLQTGRLDSRNGKGQTLLLPGVSDPKTSYDLGFNRNDYCSPYFSNIDSFFNSQMTRAPSSVLSV
ncbi:MAG: hypothetical protein A3H57_00285 [Candidatus Taylorbacteria bacterium RIFCSPLOWO2_02_FULL_43_11]|uniref:Uncharacterized protein n=1 Tax=Candidatus Taylorbacteria bacterium RIFCSPHIGHO2_02_FULL_43_32b TaxID=1802306 RepID=A0A1G2MF18_9BACT|nr:MAG: hypothetical protein A2743_00720 [Candidatus Taylorbacteria bacterium RIFCSPHIGHO2_01_FULL_43_47]OHA22500.1 MAG: hypothetical protein A3C72_00185 [Candidatus Taylorbacteria bacterium RIFCSPHIGHO2_02_FULL_43_32b]OHA35911.1 MAG: hypothetical protein A3H57_00285 [Candidatus Taylorbacteria bacterium RIFCSPLOWO2_02_FULL_43_11]